MCICNYETSRDHGFWLMTELTHSHTGKRKSNSLCTYKLHCSMRVSFGAFGCCAAASHCAARAPGYPPLLLVRSFSGPYVSDFTYEKRCYWPCAWFTNEDCNKIFSQHTTSNFAEMQKATFFRFLKCVNWVFWSSHSFLLEEKHFDQNDFFARSFIVSGPLLERGGFWKHYWRTRVSIFYGTRRTRLTDRRTPEIIND